MISKFARKAMLCAVPVFVAMTASTEASAGNAFQFRVLHDYCKAADCADGDYAVGTPFEDKEGNFYTLTHSGARFGYGALTEIEPKKGGTRYFKHVLKEFCDDETADCGSGGHPGAGVIQDFNGDLYGTNEVSSDKKHPCGTIWRIETVTRNTKFHAPIQVLHTFDGTDGCVPDFGSLDYQGKEFGQLYDGASPLFGMTNQGGSQNAGTVYELIPPKPGRNQWTQKVLVSFCNPFAPKGRAQACQTGAYPLGNLVMDQSGDIFGETTSGVVFELSPNGSGFDYNIVYQSTTGETYVGLTLETDGTLIGVADSGGPTKNGTLFSLTVPCRACNKRDTTYVYTVLHGFCTGGGNCYDGLDPNTVVVDASGNLFGTTFAGGPNAAPPNSPYTGAGTVFEYSNTGVFSVLHDFCGQDNCADGGAPYGGLMIDGNGALYGTTAGGGSTNNVKYGAGVLYELSLPVR
jgi:uncharacterized repeat protein (TIGR03803 family)